MSDIVLAVIIVAPAIPALLLLGWFLVVYRPWRRQWYGDTAPMSESNERYERDRRVGLLR